LKVLILIIFAFTAGEANVAPTAVTSSVMYPYGLLAGDQNATFFDCDNGIFAVTIVSGFTYFGVVQFKLYVS
jgi:hypothetical protein